MKISNMFHIFLYLMLLGCSSNSNKIFDNYNVHDKQYLEDSIFIIDKITTNSLINFKEMYVIDTSKISTFVEEIFYNHDKSRLVAWVGMKMNNFKTIEPYSKVERNNRMCSLGNDTVYHFNVIIGYRDMKDELIFYQWGNRQAPCYDSKQKGVEELELYYFNQIKKDYIYLVEQSGKYKGQLKKNMYKYSIIDSNFWISSPIWQKDTVGANNLYPFEIKSYWAPDDKCIRCAEANTPYIIW